MLVSRQHLVDLWRHRSSDRTEKGHNGSKDERKDMNENHEGSVYPLGWENWLWISKILMGEQGVDGKLLTRCK